MSNVLPKSSQKLQSLEGIRAFAALAVVAFHASMQAHLHGLSEQTDPILYYGKYGVQVFFVLSGFIIFYIHGNDLGDSSKVKNYLYRRWLRIWPLYAFLTIFQFVGKPILLGKEMDDPIKVITSLLFLDLDVTPIITVGWTLVHEAFFYIVFAFLIVLGRKCSFWFLIVFSAMVIVVASMSSSGNHLTEFIFSPLRWYFIAGIAAALICKGATSGNTRDARIGGGIITSLFLIGLGAFILSGEATSLAMSLTRAAGIGIVMALVAIVDIHKKLNLPKFLVYLGSASYSIYLIHSTVLDIGITALSKKMSDVVSDHLFLVMFVLSIFSVVAGILCHELCEKPLTKIVKKLTSRKA